MIKRIADRTSVWCGICFRAAARAEAVITTLMILGWSSNAVAGINCSPLVDATLWTLPTTSLPADVPDGTVYASQNLNMDVECGRKIGSGPEELGLYRYKTNFGNGVSVILEYAGNGDNTAILFRTGIIVNEMDVAGFRGRYSLPVTVKLVKTGIMDPDINPGGTDILVAKVGGISDASINGAGFFVRGRKNINFVPSTCSPQNISIPVDLGSVKINHGSGFGSGIGTTSVSRDFDVVLNCGSALPNGGGLDHPINLQLDGMTMNGFANQGVLMLNSGTANGLGIQVSKGHGSDALAPVAFGVPWQVGAFTMDRQQITVPFSARYYQTNSSVTPGDANGVATFTVSYL